MVILCSGDTAKWVLLIGSEWEFGNIPEDFPRDRKLDDPTSFRGHSDSGSWIMQSHRERIRQKLFIKRALDPCPTPALCLCPLPASSSLCLLRTTRHGCQCLFPDKLAYVSACFSPRVTNPVAPLRKRGIEGSSGPRLMVDAGKKVGRTEHRGAWKTNPELTELSGNPSHQNAMSEIQ